MKETNENDMVLTSNIELCKLRTLTNIRDCIEGNLAYWKRDLEPVLSDNIDLENRDDHWLDLTVSVDSDWSTFGYQTGDNSFVGGAYFCEHWAVTYIGHETTVDDLMDEIESKLSALIYS